MDKILPIFYSEYGRYITRFRSIPFYVDCLIPVQRRLLVSLYETARDKLTKSAKVVGYCMGKYHPHGDQSIYGTLVNLYYNGYIDKQGNFGSDGLHDANPAQQRYTECKLSKWVKDLAFEYIDYVPWDEYEFEKEPLYLPSPLPLGLIGHGIYTGIAFHRPQIPKYTISDLAKRLVGLIEGNEEIIIPNAKRCTVIDTSPEQNQFESILKTGLGKISYVPNGEIKNKKLSINGRAPNHTFNKLINATKIPEKGKQKELDVHLVDVSKKGINVEVIPGKRKMDINKLAQYIWEKYLIKQYNINVITCDENGQVVENGIDNILKNNYSAWQHAVYLKNINTTDRLYEKKKYMNIIYIIREIVNKYNSKSISDIVNHFNKDYQNISMNIEKFNFDTSTWIKKSTVITNKDIEETCSKKSIRALIEVELDLSQIDQQIADQKQIVEDTPTHCLNRLKQYI
ncbi:MAG: DNA gyrase subunit A [bacterium]